MIPENPEILHKTIVNDLYSNGKCHFQAIEIKAIVKDKFNSEVADGASKSYIIDKVGDIQGVLLVSNEVNSDLIARSVRYAQQAAELLEPNLADVIITPIAEGVFDELSYVLWPVYRDLSSSRVLMCLQKMILMPHILNWLENLTEQTRRVPEKECCDKAFAIPLTRLSKDNRLPHLMREAAEKGLERLISGKWKPFNVLHHGDLWLGNVLLPTKKTRHLHCRGFVVIDWAGANPQGYPFFDLLRLSISSGLKDKKLRSIVERHCKILSCDICDAKSYLLTAIGALGMNLEHFPERRYVSMAKDVFSHLTQIVN